jgi:hypothetical protein
MAEEPIALGLVIFEILCRKRAFIAIEHSRVQLI